MHSALVSAVQGVGGEGEGEGEKEMDGDGALGRLMQCRRSRVSGRDLSAAASVSCETSGAGALLPRVQEEAEKIYQFARNVKFPRISIVPRRASA